MCVCEGLYLTIEQSSRGWRIKGPLLVKIRHNNCTAVSIYSHCKTIKPADGDRCIRKPTGRRPSGPCNINSNLAIESFLQTDDFMAFPSLVKSNRVEKSYSAKLCFRSSLRHVCSTCVDEYGT